MATAKDPATTQPTYYLDQPLSAEIHSVNFQKLWDACEETARRYLFTLDREDYRAGLITTKPLVSRQWFEFWRPDTGDGRQVLQNSLAAVRRTIYFQFAKNADESFTVIPKVLVERQTIVERRLTDVSLYRSSFSGPLAPVQEAVDLGPTIPAEYWTPFSRDIRMEKDLARSVERRLRD